MMSQLQISQTPNETPGQLPAVDPPEPEEAVSMIVEKLDAWLEAGIDLLPNLGVAILVLLVAWVLSKLVRKALDAGLDRTSIAAPLQNLLVTLSGLVVLAVGLFVALGVVGLDRTVVSLLAGVGIIGLAVGFAFQDIAANLIAGVFLSVRRPIHVGDLVQTNGFFGTVQEINLRSTILRSQAGETVLIPNRQVFESPTTNFSTAGERRVDLQVGVSYSDDLESAKNIAMEAVEGLQERNRDREVEVFFEEFASSSIDLVVRFWIDFRRQRDFLAARSRAILAIKKAFDEGGITIPFPIRTIELSSRSPESLPRR